MTRIFLVVSLLFLILMSSFQVSSETINFSSKDFLPLDQALKKLKPGDTLLLEPGAYSLPEGVTIQKGHNGKPGKPITIKGRVREKVILDGMKLPFTVVRVEGDYWNFENLTIRDGKEYGIFIKSSHIKVKDNDFYGSGEDCIKSIYGSKDLEIINNRTFNSGHEGIDIFGTDKAKIFGNKIHDPGANGIFAKGGARNISIEGNTVFRARKAAIYIGGISDLMSKGEQNECTNCQAVNNLVIQAGAHGVFAFGCQDGLIAHNTILWTSSWYGAPLGAGNGGDSKTIGVIPSKNIRIINNIVAYPKSKAYLQVEEGSSNNFFADNNLYFGMTNPGFDWKGSILSWDDFKKVSQLETHAIFKDPKFIDPTNNNFQLDPQSPARRAGMSIEKVLDKDLNGKKRNVGSPTIGASE
ncbi:MAG: hypothetical protein C0407_06705 [Desulfobacca sp.]|nr:hypothetical protein [Desulfobacca sp.]